MDRSKQRDYLARCSLLKRLFNSESKAAESRRNSITRTHHHKLGKDLILDAF